MPRRRKVRLPKWETRGADTYELADETKEGQADINAQYNGNPANRFSYDPQPQHRIPEVGAWVMILRPLPAIERNIDRHIRVGRMFYATRSSNNTDKEGFDPSGTYRARLQTEWGDVWVWPYEYAKIETDAILAMWQSGELEFHPTDVSLAELNEQVFYARSRGMGLAQAAAMALGSVEANIGWFEPRGDLVPELEDWSRYATNEIGRLTDTNHARRAAAHKRRRV